MSLFKRNSWQHRSKSSISLKGIKFKRDLCSKLLAKILKNTLHQLYIALDGARNKATS